MNILILLLIAIVVVIVLFIALDYFASAIGGDGRLWLVMKGIIVLIALLYVLNRSGFVALG